MKVAFSLLMLSLVVLEAAGAVSQNLGVEAGKVPYVKTEVCANCHETEYQQWQQSHHAGAMLEASSSSVLADFNDTVFIKDNVRSRFYKKNDRFFVNTQGGDGSYKEFEVAYTFGVAPLQQYLVTMGDGRLQAFTIAWDTQEKGWFSLYPDEKTPPGDPLHWSSRHFTWNTMCADCHSTNLQKNYDVKTNSYATSYSAVNVDCQACHGPGAKHVSWAEGGKSSDKGLVINLKSMDSIQQLENCGRCHSRRFPISDQLVHGEPLLDHYVPARLTEGLYHTDGQVQAEVFVYGSYAQSKMFQQGVKCTDCHNAHTGELKISGNGVCLQCHQPQGNARFPTLVKKDYEAAEHHNHATNSSGAQCANCHMPTQNIMIVDARRDHSIRIPRPDLNVNLGSPNACNQCHIDKSEEWAKTAFEKWYKLDKKPTDYGSVFQKARRSDPSALEGLNKLVMNLKQPFIVRATALEHLQNYGNAGAESTIQSLSDTNPLVRLMAVINASRFGPKIRFAALTPLLSDSVRAVRIEAARALVSIPEVEFDEQTLKLHQLAMSEYEAGQLAQTDTPEANMNLGRLFWETNRQMEAELVYRRAIEQDNSLIDSHTQLAAMFQQQNLSEKAQQILEEAVAAQPLSGDLHFSLGLLFAERQEWEKARSKLARATELSPHNARVHYNLGLILQKLKRFPEALKSFKNAESSDPNNPAILQAITMLYVERSDWSRAIYSAELFRDRFPSHTLAGKLLEHVEGLARQGER